MSVRLFGSIVFSVCLILSGCSGGSGDDGGGNGDGNGDDCQGIQCLLPDAGNGGDPDAGNGGGKDGGPGGEDGGSTDPKEGKFIVGTCLDESSGNSPSGGQVCNEQWQEPVDQVPNFKSQIRTAGQMECANAGGDWTTAEAVCPTGSDYIGTCAKVASSSGAEGYVELHYYKPDEVETIKPRCTNQDGEWFVE